MSSPSRASRAHVDTADRLHSAAIHLLRRLRREDTATGLAPARLSALSVLVFGGPMNLTSLAAAEQVRPPTMTRLVQALEAQALVVRLPDATDARVVRVRATARGRRLLAAGRTRRIERLLRELDDLTPQEWRTVADAVAVLERALAR